MAANYILTLCCATVAVMSAAAATADDLQSCAAIDDASARLVCYDKLAGRQIPPGVGKWRLEYRHSLTGGGKAVFLILNADVDSSFAEPTWMTPQLVLICDTAETKAMVVPQRFMSPTMQGMDVLERVDGGDPIRATWQISGDGRSVYQPDPVPWIKSLLGAERLDIGLRPFFDKPADFSFDVEGLATAILPLESACGW